MVRPTRHGGSWSYSTVGQILANPVDMGKMRRGWKMCIRDRLYAEIDLERLPRHVASIMDGNGRWAKQHKVKVALGHRTGTETLREIKMCIRDRGKSFCQISAPGGRMAFGRCFMGLQSAAPHSPPPRGIQ